MSSPKRTVLHISDVHFGPPHLVRPAAGVLELIERHRPDLVALSGDLTQRAKPAQFRAARRFVDQIETPVLAVPGNHDVPLYRFWERFFAPFGAYRKHFDRELEPVYRDDGLVVAGVNTAHGWTFTGGLFRDRRLRQVEELFSAAPPAAFKIVVAHHHLVPPRRFDLQTVARNARRAVERYAAAGVDMILSGHFHQAFICRSDEYYPSVRPAVHIVHCGTTTSSRGRGAERGVNSCYLIEISVDELELSGLRFDAESGRFVTVVRHSFPRRAAPREPAAG